MIALLLAMSLSQAPAEELQPAPPKSRYVVLGVALGGAALLGTGAGLRLAAGGAWDRIDRGYPAFTSYDELVATRRTGELEQTLAFGFLVGGLVVLALAAVLSFVL